jgi:hypothetical protein
VGCILDGFPLVVSWHVCPLPGVGVSGLQSEIISVRGGALFRVLCRISFVGVVFGGLLSRGFSWLDINGEFDPGSGRTLAACLTHASRTVKPSGGSVANG